MSSPTAGEIAARTGVEPGDVRAVLSELRESQPESLVDVINNDGPDPIVVADAGVTCEYCSAVFDGDGVATTEIPSTTLFRCPSCGRWTESGGEQA